MAENNKKWYVLRAISGKEAKVKEYIEADVKLRGLTDKVSQVLIPTEKVVTVRNGKRIVKEKSYLPGYVLVKMTMTDESWHVVRNITGVTGFVGPGSKPVPLTDAEIEALHVENREESFAFKLGDSVSIISGMFEGYNGKIQDISEDEKQITVLASTGKRDIPIIVDAKDIKKVD